VKTRARAFFLTPATSVISKSFLAANCGTMRKLALLDTGLHINYNAADTSSLSLVERALLTQSFPWAVSFVAFATGQPHSSNRMEARATRVSTQEETSGQMTFK